MDVLTSNSDGIAKIWIKKIRKHSALKTYNAMSDESLMIMNGKLYKLLARWFENEIDKNALGAFFVNLGKERRAQSFGMSEVAYAILLSQRSVLEYITNESVLDSSLALYSVIDITNQVTDFFFLGSYYMIKGFLEDTYLALSRDESMNVEILNKYFTDDFFFKDSGKI